MNVLLLYTKVPLISIVCLKKIIENWRYFYYGKSKRKRKSDKVQFINLAKQVYILDNMFMKEKENLYIKKGLKKQEILKKDLMIFCLALIEANIYPKILYVYIKY